MEAAIANALQAAVSAALAVATAEDAKADLGALLEEWELAQQGATEDLVSILTR